MGFIASVHEGTHDLQVLHILPGSEFRISSGYQSALRVNDVRRETSPADFPQPANQKLQVHDRCDHPQESLLILDRRAHQENRSGIFALALDESLAVVYPAIPGSGVGVLQFTLKKSIRGNPSGGNALRFGVEQSCVGNFIRRTYEVFQQRPKFRRLDILLANISATGHLNCRRKIGQHHALRALVLRQVIRQGPGHRVLQQHFVGLQPVAIDGLNLR